MPDFRHQHESILTTENPVEGSDVEQHARFAVPDGRHIPRGNFQLTSSNSPLVKGFRPHVERGAILAHLLQSNDFRAVSNQTPQKLLERDTEEHEASLFKNEINLS